MNEQSKKNRSNQPKGSKHPFYYFALLLILPLATTVIMNLVFPKPPTDFGTGSMFDQIATRYDFINRALALNLDTGWRQVMVNDIIGHGSGHHFCSSGSKCGRFRVLDLATGTADVSILLAKRYRAYAYDDNEPPPQLEILGIDPSENMIQVGRKKVENQGLQNDIMLEIGDARDLKGLKDSSFNAVTMSFGIRNVPEKEKVLCEMHRVLMKKVVADRWGYVGKLAILEFTEPTYSEGGVMGLAARIFIRYVVPVIGAILSGAPREYMHLQNSIKEFPPPKEFVALMEGVKCGDEGRGTFHVDDVKYLNFGSVVLYLATPVIS